MRKIITSESVNIGHPDKTCDYIADCFLDTALEIDPHAQMAVECAIKDDLLMIYGEATTSAKIDYEAIARKALLEIGYECEFKIIKKISEQSAEINNAVTRPIPTEELASNDQGIVYGYACDETEELMPMPIVIAHKLMRKYETWRRSATAGGKFYPDAKSQVSIEYENDVPVAVHTILVSVSHSTGLTNLEIAKLITENVVKPVLAEYPKVDSSACRQIINPSGCFTIWGSFSDSGCVGRKIVVDTYGGVGRVGGGAFSSKNATKVDRSGAYYARYVAKNVVAEKLAKRCEIQVSYAIGLTDPLSIHVETFGTNKVPHEEIVLWIANNFDFSPSNMIRELDLLKPIYKQTACYGHFGREGFTWERVKSR